MGKYFEVSNTIGKWERLGEEPDKIQAEKIDSLYTIVIDSEVDIDNIKKIISIGGIDAAIIQAILMGLEISPELFKYIRAEIIQKANTMYIPDNIPQDKRWKY